jgi:hypothetical protein
MKLFISHATEDKEAVARPLASTLIKHGHAGLRRPHSFRSFAA